MKQQLVILIFLLGVMMVKGQVHFAPDQSTMHETKMIEGLVDRGQSLPELIADYEAYCAECVFDTIKQTGVIEWDHVPVYDRKGNIIHYSLGEPDTIWNEPDCPIFKHEKIRIESVLWYDGSRDYLTVTNDGVVSYIDNRPIVESTKSEKYKTRIERDYICECKRRRVVAWSDHFWNWLKSHE